MSKLWIHIGVIIRNVMEKEIEKLKALPVNSDWRLMTTEQTNRMNSQISSMRIMAKAVIVELQKESG